MAVSLKIGIGNLLAELLAHTLEVLGALKSAGTVSALLPEPLLYGCDYLLVFVQTDFHNLSITYCRL